MKLKFVIKRTYLLLKHLQNPIRSLYKFIREDQIEIQTKYGNSFQVRKGDEELGQILNILENHWSIEKLENGDLKFTRDNITLVQPSFGVLNEDLKNLYATQFDISGKNILNIGGLFGASSIICEKYGDCNKIHVYEPVPNNIDYLQENVSRNNLDDKIKLYEKAITEEDGATKISSSSPPGSIGFGNSKPGEYELSCSSISWKTLLSKMLNSEIELVLVDCEGCETHLTNLDSQLISQFPKWIIEIHGEDTKKKLVKHFKNSGFKPKILLHDYGDLWIYAFCLEE